MSGRTFAQINASLLRSKKIKECSHSERWAYICAHLTPLGSFSGQFDYPLVMWCQDAGIAPDDMPAVIEKLCKVGLIEFDMDDEFIRLVGFHRQRPPENASRVISLIGDFTVTGPENPKHEAMRVKGIAEFAVAAVQRAQGWKPDSPDWPKLRQALNAFLCWVWQEYGDEFLHFLSQELDHASKAAKGEIQSLLPPMLENDTLSTPCQDPVATRDVDETRRRRDKYEDETKTKTPQNFRENQSLDVSQVDGVEVLRRGDEPNRSALSSGPLESTKRSALVMGIKQ